MRLYLVIDTALVPPGKSFIQQIEEAIAGGVTMVQLREKNRETKDLIRLARSVHEVTKRAKVPLIINDRLDVALAIDAEGIHVGQDDIDVSTARRHLGPGKIIGVSTRTLEEAMQAVKDGADYLGIGAVYSTNTKDLGGKKPLGAEGVRAILNELPVDIEVVLIGGINPSNAHSTLVQSSSPKKQPDGVAVVSCIMGSAEPRATALALRGSVDQALGTEERKIDVQSAFCALRKTTVFVHHITNAVVKNFSANVTLAIGTSPAMSECSGEFESFARIPDSGLLLNMGMPDEENVEMFLKALRVYNALDRPVVFDPAAAGASPLRKKAAQDILGGGQLSIVKGNEGEIFAVAGLASKMRGVDSLGDASLPDKLDACAKVSRANRCVCVMTGKEDVIVDANCAKPKYAVVRSGHELLGLITGSGCSLGSVMTATCVVCSDAFTAALSALLLYTRASEFAAGRASGPGTFLTAFIDALYDLAHDSSLRWLAEAKYSVHSLQ